MENISHFRLQRLLFKETRLCYEGGSPSESPVTPPPIEMPNGGDPGQQSADRWNNANKALNSAEGVSPNQSVAAVDAALNAARDVNAGPTTGQKNTPEIAATAETNIDSFQPSGKNNATPDDQNQSTPDKEGGPEGKIGAANSAKDNSEAKEDEARGQQLILAVVNVLNKRSVRKVDGVEKVDYKIRLRLLQALKDEKLPNLSDALKDDMLAVLNCGNLPLNSVVVKVERVDGNYRVSIDGLGKQRNYMPPHVSFDDESGEVTQGFATKSQTDKMRKSAESSGK